MSVTKKYFCEVHIARKTKLLLNYAVRSLNSNE